MDSSFPFAAPYMQLTDELTKEGEGTERSKEDQRVGDRASAQQIRSKERVCDGRGPS